MRVWNELVDFVSNRLAPMLSEERDLKNLEKCARPDTWMPWCDG